MPAPSTAAFTRDRTPGRGFEFRTLDEIERHAKVLLEKEGPLKIRLIGLRLTNLRDLREVPKKTGIDKVRALAHSSLERFLRADGSLRVSSFRPPRR